MGDCYYRATVDFLREDNTQGSMSAFHNQLDKALQIGIEAAAYYAGCGYTPFLTIHRVCEACGGVGSITTRTKRTIKTKRCRGCAVRGSKLNVPEETLHRIQLDGLSSKYQSGVSTR